MTSSTEVFLGLPRFLFPCGFQKRACPVTVSNTFLKRWPIHFHLFLLISLIFQAEWCMHFICNLLNLPSFEHGPDVGRHKLDRSTGCQRWIQPCSVHVADGCHLTCLTQNWLNGWRDVGVTSRVFVRVYIPLLTRCSPFAVVAHCRNRITRVTTGACNSRLGGRASVWDFGHLSTHVRHTWRWNPLQHSEMQCSQKVSSWRVLLK